MARQKETLSKQIAEKTDAGTILKIVKASIGGDADSSDGALDDVAAYLTEPQVRRNSLIDTRVTMPLEQFTLKITEDDSLRKAVADWLKDTPLGDDQASMPLKSLVTRLLISDAVKEEEEVMAASLAIGNWVRTHGPADAPDESSVDTEPAADVPPAIHAQATVDPAKTDTKAGKAKPKVLPDELLLGMAALRMPAETIDNTDVVSMLDRAIAVAEVNGEEALVGSLQCQVARRIAGNEPERARSIFMKALDELLPPNDVQAEVQTGEEK